MKVSELTAQLNDILQRWGDCDVHVSALSDVYKDRNVAVYFNVSDVMYYYQGSPEPVVILEAKGKVQGYKYTSETQRM